MLNVKNCFSPRYQRGWVKKTIFEILSDIAKDMDVETTGISELRKPVSVVQPNWNNLMFLKYLTQRALSNLGQSCFYCYINEIILVSRC